MSIERHDFFPTCLYRFKHDFKDNELNSMIKHIEDNSLSEQNGQIVKRTGSQTQDERISIAWNIIVRGEYGEPNALQNAYI